MNECRLLNAIPLNTIPGVGPHLFSKFSRLGLDNLQDLLLHLPIRYEDRTKIYSIGDTKTGMTVTVQGEVLNRNIIFGRKRMLICHLRDNSGVIILRFFNFNQTMKTIFSPGKWVTAYGEISRGQLGNEIIHPEYHIINDNSQVNFAAELTPIYPTTNGIQQSTLRSTIDQVLKILDITPVAELLPPELSYQLMSFTAALRMLHRPPANTSLNDLALGRHQAQHRLILEELLSHNLSILAVRSKMQQYPALPLRVDNILCRRFLATLPFSLTAAQQRVIQEITQDMARNFPMMRLVQGDVGSGKTLVAALAALCTISNGRQVALMAPTELLAEQHAQNFRDWFAPLGIKVGCIAGKQTSKARQTQQGAISDGRVSMVVGTHALFQEQVQFTELALVIIDEQHRFGVHQRLALWGKCVAQGVHPHQLIMTATPIPRTLAMTAYADMDNSIIDELPTGRKPVTTVAIPDTRRAEIIQRLRHTYLQQEQCQAYWVCNIIEESNVLEAQAAKSTWQKLQSALPEIRIGLVHGRMKVPEQQQMMKAFKAGEVQLLVATTVIEVGVNVPNASLIIIEDPERLGLAQLHQLRGRVGRGTMSSHCVLLYKPPLNKIAKLRLQVLRDNNDGFVIAQRDLEIRGPGELLGTRQTGKVKFRIANILRDQALIPEVQRLARYLNQYHPELASALIERWRPERVLYTFA
ncbi:ATP-dependent DNA helicase recG [Candidatus Moranella endobia PCVAL]|uniref:ATP-dependent DNA helicase RecG n=1 Tax=Moranella endobia (strain PCIT) TaxID=903503 RepID=F7XXL3_MOREP|nr:ATP-dependent DNA helicase RecG [Candidatus Moranella endobia]AEI74839.1 ATP-dependent DNA helicase RecG [Candidatus Moranella endobia PCIT]AGJ61085.1 ATP-dependent DNA helicase recG [Candidatus Moranella endobia PCVAL]